MGESRGSAAMVAVGVLLAAVLIWVGAGGRVGRNPALEQQFSPRPPAPGEPTAAPFELPQVRLPDLPPEVQQAVSDVQSRLDAGQSAPALTPVARGPRARVEVAEVRRAGGKIQVRGTVANDADAPLTIPPGAFSFRDSDGTRYATAGSGGATLQPGESTPFELSVPLPAGRGLVMILTLPPDAPIEQALILAVTP